MKNYLRKPTLFLILGLIIILVGLPFGIYGLTLSGGASLGGTLILVLVFIVFIFLVIDRVLVHVISLKKLNIIEVMFLFIASTIYLYQNRKIEIELLNKNSEFMIVIENNGKLINNYYDCKLPFNKLIKTNENYIIAKNIPQDINIKGDISWKNSYNYNIYNYEKYPKVVLFAKTSSDMDSLKVLKFIELNLK